MVSLALASLIGNTVRAASTVIAEGIATITSDINIKEYRKRAVENALQNIALEREQALTSFSIVENGQMLFDQVQSISRAGILSYEIIDEKKKNHNYHVTIEAVVEDFSQKNSQSDVVLPCRKPILSKVDLSVNVKIDTQQFPPWIGLDNEWLINQISETSFNPKIEIISKKIKANRSESSYSLFENSKAKPNSDKIYKFILNLKFSKLQNESFFVKDNKLALNLNSKILRHGKTIHSFNENFAFTIKKKFGTGIPIQSNKTIWQNEKKRLVNTLVRRLKNNLEQIKCVTIQAELKRKNSQYFIEYGKLDGLTKDDIFILQSLKTEKFYFKVEKIDNHRSQLDLISEVGRLNFDNGQTVRIVEGL